MTTSRTTTLNPTPRPNERTGQDAAAQRSAARRRDRSRTLGLWAVGVCVPMALAACSSSDDETDSDASVPAETSVSGASQESIAPVDLAADRVEAATGFWEAVAAGDRDAAASFTDPKFLDARFNALFGRAETFNDQFDWYESVGWTWTLDECTERDTTRVNCFVAASNPWSDALGESPVSGTFVVAFSDDGITSIGDRSFTDQWVSNVFRPFQQWVVENHPDDAEVMFNFSVDVNPEILDLYEINTERFAEADQDS